MARRCLHCERDGSAPAPGFLYCEECRVRLIKAGMVELALPGEISERGGFTPYLEVRRGLAEAEAVQLRRRHS